MTNQELIDLFLLEKALSAAPSTLEYYQENLNKFYSYYQKFLCSAEYSNEVEKFNKYLLKLS